MKAFLDDLLSDTPELEKTFADLVDDMPRGQARTRARQALQDYRRGQARPEPRRVHRARPAA
jgi:hypothetical protein